MPALAASTSIASVKLCYKDNLRTRRPDTPTQHSNMSPFTIAVKKPLEALPFERRRPIITDPSRMRSASVICASALNARCGAEQTQTITRESSTATIAPVDGKTPKLDDGGVGFPPFDSGGGGGGGGGGGNFSGGFFLFAFLAFLGFLKDQEQTERDRQG